MIHLAVARGVCERLAITPTPQILLGSLAPDAIHMRAGHTRQDKNRSHLRTGAYSWPEDWPAPVLAWLDGYDEAETPLRELAWGYAVHLLTDRHWAASVVAAFRARVPPEWDDGQLRTVYYRETDQIDGDLYRSAPWRPAVWEALAAARPADLPGMVSADEVDAWRRRTLAWFDDPAHNPGVAPEYITRAQVGAFIGEATDVVVHALGDRVE
jgi:hypothetical protein